MDLNYLKSKAVYVLTAVISVFLVMYIGFQMKITADDEEYVEVVSSQKVTVITELSGYIFSDEELLVDKEHQEGVCIPCVSDGSYVDKGTVVARVYPEGTRQTALKIAEIDKKIAVLKESMKANQGIISSKEYDKAVTGAYYSVITAASRGDLFTARRGIDKWILSQGKKSIAISLVTGYGAQLQTLEEQRAELVAELGEGKDVKVKTTGRYYSTADGYEDSFEYSLAKSGGYEKMKALFDGLEKAESEGVVCGKMLYSTKWYFVIPFEDEKEVLFTAGKKYTVAFEENGGKELTLVYERTLKSLPSGEAYGVFYCNEIPPEFSLVRFQNVGIKTASYEGLCIPTSSVRYVDGQVGVYIAKGNKAEFRRVKIIGEKDGSYIVKPAGDFAKSESEYPERSKYLAQYDTVITSGKNIYEGKYIDMSKF